MTTKAKLWASVGKFTPKPGCRKQTKIWTTGTGQKLRICDMTHQHLINSIKLLERQAEIAYSDTMANAYATACTFDSESMASYYAEQDIDKMEEEGSEGLLPDIYYNLKEELERRNLDAPKEIRKTKKDI